MPEIIHHLSPDERLDLMEKGIKQKDAQREKKAGEFYPEPEKHEDSIVEHAVRGFLIDYFTRHSEREVMQSRDDVWFDSMEFPKDGFDKLKVGDFNITELRRTPSSSVRQEYSKYEYGFYIFGHKFFLSGRAAQAVEESFLSVPGRLPEMPEQEIRGSGNA